MADINALIAAGPHTQGIDVAGNMMKVEQLKRMQQVNQLSGLQEDRLQRQDQRAADEQELEQLVMGAQAFVSAYDTGGMPAAEAVMRSFPDHGKLGEAKREWFASDDKEASVNSARALASLADKFGGRAQSKPASVQEYEYFSGLSDDQQQVFNSLKRADKIVMVGKVPHITVGGQAIPLNTPEGQASLEREVNAASAISEAEGGGKVRGEAGATVDTAFPVAEAERIAKARSSLPAEVVQLADISSKANQQLHALSRADSAIGFSSTGRTGQFIAFVRPGSDAGKLRRAVQTVKAAQFLDELAALKRLSANGSTGLGQSTERELDQLQRRVANLDELADPDELRESLAIVFDQYNKIKETIQLKIDFYNRSEEEGWSQDEWKKQERKFINDEIEILSRPIDTESMSGAPKEIKTQEEYDALPSGAVYLENGKRYRKP